MTVAEVQFPETSNYRAKCTNVVDGDTVDLVVDMGFHCSFSGRFRLLGIDTPELNSKDPVLKARAHVAKDRVISLLAPGSTKWNMFVQIQKDTDNFGRWLASIGFQAADGTMFNLNELLLNEGLAVRYVK